MEQLKTLFKTYENKDLTLDEILKGDSLNSMLPPYSRRFIEDEASHRFGKWLSKKGKNFDKSAQARMESFTLVKVHAEELVRYVCSVYGLAGGKALSLHAFATRILKVLATKKPMEWENLLKIEVESWNKRFETDSRVLKVVAIVVAKAYASLVLKA